MLMVPNGIETNTTEGVVEHYGGTVSEDLPLAAAHSIEDTVATIRQAGFQHVTAIPLIEVFTLDQAAGVAPGHHVQMQHIITATKACTIDPGTDPAQIAAEAIAHLKPELDLWTSAFALCADPTRLKLLIALHEADVTEPRSHGRHRRWRLTHRHIHGLLHHVAAPHSDLHPDHP